MASWPTVSGRVVSRSIAQKNVVEESWQPPASQGKSEKRMRVALGGGV